MATNDVALPLFPNFVTPDLGCIVRRKHELEVEVGSANIHVQFLPSIELLSGPAHGPAHRRVTEL